MTRATHISDALGVGRGVKIRSSVCGPFCVAVWWLRERTVPPAVKVGMLLMKTMLIFKRLLSLSLPQHGTHIYREYAGRYLSSFSQRKHSHTTLFKTRPRALRYKRDKERIKQRRILDGAMQ
jgi:hypothetical protein